MEQYHSTGCKCRWCYGLAEFMQAETGKTYGLPPAPGHSVEAEEPSPCESMTCICPRCAAERAQLRSRPIRQPWEAKPARAA